MDPLLHPAPWLSNERIGLRAPLLGDVPVADRWDVDASGRDLDAAERELRRRESIPWGGNPVLELVVVDRSSGEIVGGVRVTRVANRTSRVEVRVPEGAGRAGILADVLGLVLPWLLGELGLMTVVLETPEDDKALVVAAKEAGMTEAVRRREHVRRAEGRVDLLQLERVNREWGRYAG